MKSRAAVARRRSSALPFIAWNAPQTIAVRHERPDAAGLLGAAITAASPPTRVLKPGRR